MDMDISSLSSRDFYLKYGDNIGSQVYENIVTPFDLRRGLLIAAYSILFLIGACGNSWLACVITCALIRSRSSEAPRSVQIFILALCCFDLLVLLFLTLLIAEFAFGRWVIESPWVCLLYLSSESLNKFCSPFLLIALSCVCCLSICLNTNVNRYSNSNSRIPLIPLMVVVICAVIMIALVTPVYIYSDIHYLVYENSTELWAVIPKCTFQPPEGVLTSFTIYTFVIGYVVPAYLFTLFYGVVLILMYVRRHARHSTVNSLHFWRVAKTTMGLVCFYLTCWTPYWVLNMYEYFRPLSMSVDDDVYVPSDTTVVMGYFIHMLPYVSCCGYPLIYMILNRNITQTEPNRNRTEIEPKPNRTEISIQSTPLIRSDAGASQPNRSIKELPL